MNATVGLFAHRLAPFRRRLQWRDGLRAAWIATSGGLAFTCLLLIAGRLHPLLFQRQLLFIGLSFTLFLLSFGQIFAWFRPLSLSKLARLGDARLGLDERLITALELAEGRLETSPDLKQAQLDDTFQRLNRVSLRDAIPLAKRKSRYFAIGTLLALTTTATALTVIPNPQQSTLEERAELAEFLETEIAELAEIQAEMLPEIDAAGASQIEPAAETLDALIDRLQAARNDLSPESALAALSEADQTLQEIDRQREAQDQALNQLASSLTNSALAASTEQTAAEALEQLASNPPTGAEADALAQSLSEAASAVAGNNPALAQSLQQAATALQSGDAQGAQAALSQAAGQLAQSDAQGAANAARIQQALQNIQQARAQLAQQNGQGTGGQSAGQGTGQGNGSGTGSGSGRGDPGAGNDGLFSAQGVDGTISTDNGPNQNRLDDYNSVFAPDHLGGEGGDFVVPDQQGADGSGIDIGETPLNPNRPPGEATVPYTEVYREYADQAGAALDGEYIPLGMKDYVRQYFGSLEP